MANRRFRWILLALAGFPLAVNYLWWTLLWPLLARPRFSDQSFVFAAARAIRAGSDPYAWIAGGYSYGKPVYIYPPLWAWLQQPLVPLGDETAALLLLLLLQLCLAGAMLLLYRALRPVDPQEVALGVILAISFVPVFANLWAGQVNLLVLLLVAAGLVAYTRGDGWWGGAAFGLAMALKPLELLVGAQLLSGRRWRMLAAGLAAGAVASFLPGPRLLLHYLSAVLPAAAAATGFRDNAAPAGLITRLLHPATFYDGGAPADLLARGLHLTVVVGVILLSLWGGGRRLRPRAPGRALEYGMAMAASPLVLTIAHSFHLVLLLVPILVLLHLGLTSGDRLALGAALGSWLLVGPIHGGMLSAIGSGFSNDLLLRVWNETPLLGMLVLWSGFLFALRDRSSSRPAPPWSRSRSSR